MKTISVIIPLYNEEEGIDFLVNELNEYFNLPHQFKTEVIFVNDGSSDKTFEKLKQAKHVSYRAVGCNLSKNYGSHAALRAGILSATGDYICFMYADLQDPIQLIERLHSKIESGSQVVWARRSKVKNSFFERLFSKMYAWMMRKYVSRDFPEKGFDVVMFTKAIAHQLNNNIENNSSIFLHILTLGFRQDWIEYEKNTRKFGKSKWTISKKIKLLVDSFVAFSYMPIRLVSFIGISFFLLGLLMSGYYILRKIYYNDLQSGWPQIMVILLLGFGITNIALGIIAEYLWRTLDASRKRPVFIVDEIIELNK